MNPPTQILKPMLVHDYEPRYVEGKYPLLVQPKLNGIRAVWHDGVLRSRDGKRFSDKVLTHVYDRLRKTFPDTTLDGELYVHGWPLQRINSACAVKRKKHTEDSASISYCIFDRPFDRRLYLLTSLQKPELREALTMIAATYADTEATLRDYYHQALAYDYEGLIIRLPGAYEPGKRSYNVLRLKPHLSKKFAVTGILEGKGRLRGTTGALVCKTTSGLVFTAGSGLSDGDRVQIWDASRLGKVVPAGATVKFECYSGDQIPLKPTIIDYTYDATTVTERDLSMEPVRHHNI